MPSIKLEKASALKHLNQARNEYGQADERLYANPSAWPTVSSIRTNSSPAVSLRATLSTPKVESRSSTPVFATPQPRSALRPAMFTPATGRKKEVKDMDEVLSMLRSTNIGPSTATAKRSPQRIPASTRALTDILEGSQLLLKSINEGRRADAAPYRPMYKPAHASGNYGESLARCAELLGME
ncbi:hypothetical protein J8273_0452 [Carpediemonas membranifera]|uniref:Uncharacterized protein n=1 Tax=Carpediemonas membranifera TaxID=201153 RepID=A0A8J6BDI3_9EUKA|nr:hypothetical protein J8273_0452 [Carpediemonas membranifera]|eukprot:KAG9395232.1 hypothetical protein J8273_0452 [Carpediemonas membranifera]